MAVVEGGSKCNLITGYTIGADASIHYGRHRWLAQTFTLDATYVAWRCRFLTFSTWTGWFYHYALRATDGSGQPTGADLATTTLSPTGESKWEEGKWRRFDFSTSNILPPGVYALVASVPDAISDTSKHIRADSSAPAYPQGKAWISDNDGVDWSEIPDTDLMFQVWGWEPPPVADPEPVISNWAPLDYTHTDLLQGFSIVITTDNKCHLWMRWTDKKPLKHPLTEYRRGILVPTGTRYCFVAWKEIEQTEPGDTLEHTFHCPDWLVCQTRYFYFIGTKQLEESPSASPIFYLHRTADLTPSVYGPILASMDGRTIQSRHAVWNTCHDAPTGNVGTWHEAPLYRIVSGATQTAVFFIERAFISFPLWGIPVGSQIVYADLKLKIQIKVKTSSAMYPHIIITEGVQHDVVIPSDFGDQLPYTVVGGAIDIDDLVVGEFCTIPLNPAGLAWINPGGWTKLCIRQEMDVIDSLPPLGANQIAWWSSQYYMAFIANLTVGYIPP